MDDPALPTTELARALRQVARVNFLLGGFRSLLRHLRRLAGGRTELSVLDIGVGNGQLSRGLAERLERGGVRMRWTGIDLQQKVLGVARAGTGRGDPVGLVRADARQLPFPDRSFDVSMATLTLHHIEDEDCVGVLAEMGRVSRVAVIVSDLERHPVHYLGARFLSLTWWRRDRVTRHDGPISVLRSFTGEELLRLAEEARLEAAEVHRYFPFRLVLEARRP